MIVKPAIGFLGTDTDAQLITDTENIISLMTNNPAYPSPAPTLAMVTAAKNDFAAAVANAANGGTTLTVKAIAPVAVFIAVLWFPMAEIVVGYVACRYSSPSVFKKATSAR